jgi:cytochrome c
MRALWIALALASLAGAVAAAPPAALRRGEEVYARCAGCHAIEGNRTGPQHCGIFGRRAGTAPGFAGYSAAMRGSGIVWSERELDAFLRDPGARVPGTTMGYAGVKDKQERADLVAWLKQATRPGRCSLQ